MKLKLNNKKIEIVAIEMDGDWRRFDLGDFSGAFIAEAFELFADGSFRDLSEDECTQITKENPREVNALAMEWATP